MSWLKGSPNHRGPRRCSIHFVGRQRIAFGMTHVKTPVPNICPESGVSRDFRLAYGNLVNYLERVEASDTPRTRFLSKRSLLHRPIPRYEAYFSSEKYDGVITHKNAVVVARINELVDRLNALREEENTDYATLAPLRAALDALIAGGSSAASSG